MKFNLVFLLFLFLFYHSCASKSVVKEPEEIEIEEIETNQLFVTEDITEISNRLKVIIIPLENKSSKDKFRSTEVTKAIIQGSLYTFLQIVPSFDMPDKLEMNKLSPKFLYKQEITPQDIYSNYQADIIIYGDIAIKENKKTKALVNLKVWTRATGKIESKKYITPTDADIFDSIDLMLANIIKLTLNEEMKIAHLNFKDFKINNGKYHLFINEKLVAKITNTDFNLSLRILANAEYSVRLKNLYNNSTILYTKFALKPGETTNINHIALANIKCLITNKTPDEEFRIYLDGKEITLDKTISNIPAEREVKLLVTNINNGEFYTLKNYLVDGTEKVLILPRARMLLNENNYNPILFCSQTAKISSFFSEEYMWQDKKSLVINFFTPPESWATAIFNFGNSKMDWSNMNTLKIWIYGKKSYKEFFITLIDKGNERFICKIRGKWIGFRHITIPLKKIKFRRDYQERLAKINYRIDYPLKGFEFNLDTYTSPANAGKFELIINEMEVTRE